MPRQRIAADADRGGDVLLEELGVTQSAAEARGEADDRPFVSMPDMGRYGPIVTKVFDLPNPEEAFDRLLEALRVGTREFDSLQEAIDNAETNAREAHRLYVCAREQQEAFMIDAKIVEGAIRERAMGSLQAEKASGQRAKAITEADVEAKATTLFPEEWRELRMREVRARKMVEHLEHLAGLWKGRCFTLASMLSSRRA